MNFNYLKLFNIDSLAGRTLIHFLFLTIFFINPINAATYKYYFSNSGGGSECSQGSPCASLNDAQKKVDAAGSSDTVYLFFKRGDKWTVQTQYASRTRCYGIDVSDSNPTVHINAYGTGAKPILDGGVTDFSRVASHNTSTGPLQWSNMIHLKKDGCTVKNIKINGTYGRAIEIGDELDPADNITIDNCEFTNIGGSTIRASTYYGTSNTTITNNFLQTTGELWMNEKTKNQQSDWAIAIALHPQPGSRRNTSGNLVAHNIIDGNSGEGIHSVNGIIEYNIVGDTGSVGIFCNPFANDPTDTIIRYNLVTHEDWSISVYDDNIINGSEHIAPNGIAVYDELAGGSNAGATVEVYGNIVINRYFGIWFDDVGDRSPWGSVKIYNNTVIDSHKTNYVIGDDYDVVAAGQGFIYNNASILYDRTGASHAADWGDPSGLSNYWQITDNAFWTTGGNPIVDPDWRKNYVTNDPKLAGEEDRLSVDWDGQSGMTYYKDITNADVKPVSGSSLMDSQERIIYGSKWDVGATTLPKGESVLQAPVGLKIISE